MTLPPEPPLAPVSWGELLDKITILEIKAARIAAAPARANVARELALLQAIAAPALQRADLAPPLQQLRRVNDALWDIEDAIRLHETRQDFGEQFIVLARSVYQTNDERAAIKRRINDLLGSALVEEKSYTAG